MGIVTLTGSTVGTMALTFPYSPDFVVKVKSIPGHRSHPHDKYRLFPHTAREANVPRPHRHTRALDSTSLEDLRREMVSRKYSKTTAIYTHMSTKNIGKIRSPLDNLNLEGG